MGQNGNLLFVPQRNNEEMDVIEVTLTNALPIPKNCSIEKILEFKNKRRAEFLNFQFVFDEMKDNIKNSENKHMALLKEKEKIEKALLELNKVFHESKFEKTVRTIKTFINIDDSALLSSLFPLIGTMTAGRFSISPEIGTLVGLGINASINLSMKKESKIETLGLDLKPYAYLFEVENIK